VSQSARIRIQSEGIAKNVGEHLCCLLPSALRPPRNRPTTGEKKCPMLNFFLTEVKQNGRTDSNTPNRSQIRFRRLPTVRPLIENNSASRHASMQVLRQREGHRPAGVAKGQFDLMEVVVRSHLLLNDQQVTHTHRQRTTPLTPTHTLTARTTPQAPKRTPPTNT